MLDARVTQLACQTRMRRLPSSQPDGPTQVTENLWKVENLRVNQSHGPLCPNDKGLLETTVTGNAGPGRLARLEGSLGAKKDALERESRYRAALSK